MIEPVETWEQFNVRVTEMASALLRGAIQTGRIDRGNLPGLLNCSRAQIDLFLHPKRILPPKWVDRILVVLGMTWPELGLLARPDRRRKRKEIETEETQPPAEYGESHPGRNIRVKMVGSKVVSVEVQQEEKNKESVE